MTASPRRNAEKRKKSRLRQLLEYAGVWLAIFFVRLVPFRASMAVCRFAGDTFFFLARSRRTTAIDNLLMAYGPEKSPAEIREIAKRSIRSFFMTCFEMIWITGQRPGEKPEIRMDEFELGRQLIREIYDKAGGIIFVTPHLGNWEIFLHLARLAEIPLTIVARPMDNPLLERLVTRGRSASGQRIVHKKNAMFVMEDALRQGTCVGILADQSSRGIAANFFGRPAFTTVIPAMLAYKYNRPIVVVACVRMDEALLYRGMMSDPLWPDLTQEEGAEVQRLTEAMNHWMETFIRAHPDQWLWMHNRWKRVSRSLSISQ